MYSRNDKETAVTVPFILGSYFWKLSFSLKMETTLLFHKSTQPIHQQEKKIEIQAIDTKRHRRSSKGQGTGENAQCHQGNALGENKWVPFHNHSISTSSKADI